MAHTSWYTRVRDVPTFSDSANESALMRLPRCYLVVRLPKQPASKPAYYSGRRAERAERGQRAERAEGREFREIREDRESKDDKEKGRMGHT